MRIVCRSVCRQWRRLVSPPLRSIAFGYRAAAMKQRGPPGVGPADEPRCGPVRTHLLPERLAQETSKTLEWLSRMGCLMARNTILQRRLLLVRSMRWSGYVLRTTETYGGSKKAAKHGHIHILVEMNERHALNRKFCLPWAIERWEHTRGRFRMADRYVRRRPR